MKKPWLVINSTGGPALLAILGAAVTLWPPETWEIRAAYFAAFLVVGIISVVSAVRLSLASGREIDTLISGGDNFCFFRIEPSSANIRDGQFQLMMEAIGGPVFGLNYWICPASANRDGTDPAYSSLDTRKPLHPIIHRGVTGWDRGLPVGEYFIGFDARNGGWNEELKIFLQDGKPRQTIIVSSMILRSREWDIGALCCGICFLGFVFVHKSHNIGHLPKPNRKPRRHRWRELGRLVNADEISIPRRLGDLLTFSDETGQPD